MNKFVFVCLFLAVGCSSKAQKKEVVVEEKKIEEEKVELSDKGPLFELSNESSFLAKQKTIRQKVKSTEFYQTKSHTYLRVNLLTDAPDYHRVPFDSRINIPELKGQHLVGAERKDVLYIRIVGKVDLPKSFTINAENPNVKLTLEIDSSKKVRKSFKNDFFMAYIPRSRMDTPYDNFVVDRLITMSGKRKKQARRNDGPSSSTEYTRLMNLYSGATSIRETLQNDRHLRGVKSEKRTLDVKTLPTPPLAKHPWKEMIAELKSAPVIEPMAAYIPADKGYAHFHDLRTFVKVAKELDKLSPAIQGLEGDGGTREFADYYEKQLVLERTGVAELLGHKAAKSVALVMGDSFVREGTDVGLLFRIENKTLLEAALNKFETSARAKHLKMNQFSIKVGDVDVRRIYTDDLSVNQFRASYGDVLLVANSLELVTDLVNTFTKRKPSLKDEGDFRYMRTKYPFSEKNESGFIFLSDAFVAKVISPQTRIASVRRFEREADIAAVNFGAMLYAKLEGKLPVDLKELAASGIMTKEEFSHRDGSVISYSTQKGASSKYGSARMMRPLSAFPVSLVSKSEADAYKRFQETYQSYWQKFIDPIAVQLRYDDEGKNLSAEVRILPIIDSSEYDRLIEMVGQAQAPRFKKVTDGIEWTFAIGENARLRKELESSSNSFAGFTTSWLGSWVQVGAADHSRFWDLMLSGLGLPMKSTETGESTYAGMGSIMKVVQEMPTHLAVEIANELVFAGVLTKVKSKVDQTAPGAVKWTPLEETYREQLIVQVSGKDNYIGELNLYYTIVNGVFVIAPRLDYLKLQIDKFLSVPEMTAGQSNVGIVLQEKGWMSKLFQTTVHAGPVHEAHLKAMGIMEDTIFDGKYNAQQSLHFQGFLPRSPFDGTVGVKEGAVYHSAFDSILEMDLRKMKSSLSDQIAQTRSLDGSISFDGKDNHRSLLIKLEWKKH